MEGNKRKQNGITLIALIITVIVMLILVGVTINVALNGGLFTQAQEAANNTQMEAEREELLSAIVAVYDISTGTISGKEELEEKLGTGWTVEEVDTGYKIISPDGNVFTVDAKGNITDINGKGNGDVNPSSETYTFTIGKLVAMKGVSDKWGAFSVSAEVFWPTTISDNLKNSTIEKQATFGDGISECTTYNIICLNNNYTNVLASDNPDFRTYGPNSFALLVSGDNLQLMVSNEEGTILTLENYEDYKDLAFTISMADGSSGSTGGSSSSDTEVDETLARYLLGEGLGGRNIYDIMDSSGNFTDDKTTSDVNEEITLNVQGMISDGSIASDGIGEVTYYLKYDNKVYKIGVEFKNSTFETKKGTLELVYEPNGSEGQTREFNGEQWTILYDTDDYIEILSPKVLGELHLNKGDLEECISCYNEAIYLINQYCKDQISDDLANDVNVRSVGRATETTTMYTSTKYALKNNGEGKDEDSDYLEDFIRMKFYEVDNPGNDYWVASRELYGKDTGMVDYKVRQYDAYSSSIGSFGLWTSTVSKSNTFTNMDYYGVRPIVKIMK